MLDVNQTLVTVLVPCYNAARYLRSSIESILNQSYFNLEVILINDGSSDDTQLIINEYANQDARILSVINEKNLGLIRTLNKGLELASGDYIARMDADDVSHPERIMLQVTKLQQNPELDLVACEFWFMDHTDRVLGPVKSKAFHSVPLKFVSLFRTPVVHPSIVCKASVLKSYRFDSDYLHSEDFELFSRMLFDGKRFEVLNKLLYYYRTSQQSVSVASESYQIETHVKVSSRNILKYVGEVPDEKVLRVVCNRMNFVPDSKVMFTSFRKIDQYKRLYIEREKTLNSDRSEIQKFVVYHKVDILLQSIKRQNVIGLIKFVPFLISNFYLLLTPYGISYLVEKIRFRY